MSPSEGQEELEEVQSELRKRDDEVNNFFFNHFVQFNTYSSYINIYVYILA